MEQYIDSFVRMIRSSTGRLALTYLTIIMVMSLGFSIVIYAVSANQLDNRLPPREQRIGYNDMFEGSSGLAQRIESFLQRRIDQEKSELAWRMAGINLFVLFAGGALSYYLARQALAPIEAAMASKDQFISDASHELRTPLTALQTTNEVALRRKKLTLSDARELIADTIIEVKRLQDLTDGLLGLLKEDSGAKQETVRLYEIVSESLNRIIVSAQHKNISVNDDIVHATLRTDPIMLEQILTILLDNAIKYSPDNTTISLTAKKYKKNIIIAVKDQGAGIRTEDLPYIFDRFYRADQSRSQGDTEGYGLGLAIARKLARQIGAELTVKSTLGNGSTFSLVFTKTR